MYSLKRILKSIYWLLLGKTAQRRRVRQELARIAANMFGDFPLSEDYQQWRTDDKFLEDFKRLSPGNPYSQDRKYVLREFAKLTSTINGSIAECGSYQGASTYFIAQVDPDTEICVFDSFEGLPEPSEEDRIRSSEHMDWQKGDLSAGETIIRENLSRYNNIVYYKGWIPQRFSEVRDKQFKLVHIDVDLYQPTKDSIEFFYPRMLAGGVIVLDDYGFTNCPGAYRAASEFMKNKKEVILNLTTGQGIILFI